MAESFTGLFPGRQYVASAGPDGVWIRDGDSRAVAYLPVTPGGVVESAAGRWRVAVERPRRGWVVVARSLTSEEPVACAYPRGWPNGFKLGVAPEQEYRLRAKPFAGTSILRGELGEIARFGPGLRRAVTLAEAVTPDPRLTLVVLLAYEAIRYSAQIPEPVVAGGVG